MRKTINIREMFGKLRLRDRGGSRRFFRFEHSMAGLCSRLADELALARRRRCTVKTISDLMSCLRRTQR